MPSIPQTVGWIRETRSKYGLPRVVFLMLKHIGSKTAGFTFHTQEWFIYQQNTSAVLDRNEEHLRPGEDGFNLRVVTDTAALMRLGDEGIDLVSFPRNTRRQLEAGAIAFCLFSGQTLVHLGWLCLNTEARDSVIPIRYQVDFSQMACVEGSQTLGHDSRGKTAGAYSSYKGLFAYCYYKRLEYLHKLNIPLARSAVLPRNRASILTMERFGARKVSRIRLVKLMFFKHWREVPVANRGMYA